MATHPPVHLYQIAYSPESLAAIAPPFLVLNNLANPRPDWYEYGPVREFLQTVPLDENAYYGFFSPKFGLKTSLQHAEVEAFVHRHAAKADVMLFSPHPNQVAFFTNVFEQGEFFHHGLMHAAQSLMNALGEPIALPNLVMDASQMVFCNYFVAKPAFWREWLRWGERLYAICEGPPSELQALLTQSTSYTGGTQMKIFIMERLASLLLTVQPRWRSAAHNPYNQGWPTEALQRDPSDAIISCALKHAMRTQPFPDYYTAFTTVRQRVMGVRAPA